MNADVEGAKTAVAELRRVPAVQAVPAWAGAWHVLLADDEIVTVEWVEGTWVVREH